MTELQKIELEMLKVIVDICDKLNLTYYLVCGSALGAVKYGGFIPWDDDLDVGLPRKDYEILIQKAQSMLPENLFLQNYHTDKAFPQIFSKLRNNNTTYIEKSVARLDMHHGVYIDIFPLDGYPKKEKEARILEQKKHLYTLQVSCVYNLQYSKKAKLFFTMERLLGFHKRTNHTVRKLENLFSQYSTEDSMLWCNHGNWQGKLEYAPCEQYGDGIMMQFEGLEVRVPAQYDAYLTQKYGDWRADLPVEQQVGHHYYTVLDLDKPYTYYTGKAEKN